MINRIGYTNENLKAVVDTFIQMPRFLDNPEFADLSIHAKVLYAYLLDRLKLSLSSNWFDEESGQVYMYYKREEMQQKLKLTAKPVKKVVEELKAHNLMAEKVQGINLPNRIFLYAPAEDYSGADTPPNDTEGEQFPIGQGHSPPSDVEKIPPRTGNNSPSGHGETPTPDREILPPIKNESNKNEDRQNEDSKNEGRKTTTTTDPEKPRYVAPAGQAAAAEASPPTGIPVPLSTPLPVPF